VVAVGFVWPRSTRELSPWLMSETAASGLWGELAGAALLDSPLANPHNERIVLAMFAQVERSQSNGSRPAHPRPAPTTPM
jgi:hypothetical protein